MRRSWPLSYQLRGRSPKTQAGLPECLAGPYLAGRLQQAAPAPFPGGPWPRRICCFPGQDPSRRKDGYLGGKQGQPIGKS